MQNVHVIVPNPDEVPPPPPAPASDSGQDGPVEESQFAIEQKVLVSSVLKAVQPIDPAHLSPLAAADAGIACQPKSMLALLTYCYALGILGSRQIERSLQENHLFRLLCNNEVPNRQAIEQFRRINRYALHQTLHAACIEAICQNTPCGAQPCPLLSGSMRTADEMARAQAMSRRLADLIDRLIEKAAWLDRLNLEA